MALQLETNFKGISANYWRIVRFDYSDIENKGLIRLGLYKDKATRDADVKNVLNITPINADGLDSIPIPASDDDFWTDVNTARDMVAKLLYLKMKESKMVDNPNFDSEQPESDDNPAQIESNPFANAEDC